MRRNALNREGRVRLHIRRRHDVHSRIGRNADIGLRHAHANQLITRGIVAQGDDIYRLIQNARSGAAVALLVYGADAAAVHNDTAPQLLRRP